jgi:arylformamidase
MTGGRIRDISQTLSHRLPIWPGDTPFSSEKHWSYSTECPVNVSSFRLSTHSGTHSDAPLHYDPHGAAIADVDLTAYLGPARVVDLRGHGRRITPEMVLPALGGIPRQRLLFRTYDHFPRASWDADFTSVSPEVVELIAAHGVILIGTDAPSLDPQNSKTMDAHLAVKETGLRILEGLVLDGIEAGDYELIALPLKLAGLDASPVRAVLRDLE